MCIPIAAKLWLQRLLELRDRSRNYALRILTGGGDKIFSAGWDLKALNSMVKLQLDNWWETADDYGVGGFAGLDRELER